jgi:hypothetical protein
VQQSRYRGRHVTALAINILGSLTTIAIFAATLGLILTWFL